MNTWNIGLDSWIIQDGNYPDFSTGDERQFALEFTAKQLSLSVATNTYVKHLSGARYGFAGDVVFVTDDAWVIDFGLPAYTEARAPNFVVPSVRVEGDLYLGLDPFTYMESLHSVSGMPNLFRNFQVEGILLETTPLIPGYAGATPTLVRDESKESYISVLKTDAWHDDNKNAHYVLQCRLLPSQPPNTPLQPTAEKRGG